MLSLSYNQVNMALHHARKKVCECLEEKGFEYRPVTAPGPIGEVILRFEDELLVHFDGGRQEEDDE